MSPQPKPPPLAYRYALDIDGFGSPLEVTDISSVSIEMKTADQKVAIGDGKVYLHSYPGLANYGDIVFKAIKVYDLDEMYDWLQAVVDGQFTKSLRNGTIYQLTPDKSSKDFTGDRWHFEQAWPSKWELGASGAGTVALIVETLTLKPARIWRD